MADVDPSEILASTAAASFMYSGRHLVGPIFDSWAAGVVERHGEKRRKNLEALVFNAASKTDLGRPGSIPSRVAAHILEEGTWSDEPIMQEYLGGVLASSRTEGGRDDRGARWAGLVTRLSSYEIRAHFVLYTIAHQLTSGRGFDPFDVKKLEMFAMYVPRDVFVAGMDFREDEEESILIAHAVYGLAREDLASDLVFGGLRILQHVAPNAPGVGVVFTPSTGGIELYMWALGLGQHPLHEFSSATVQVPAALAATIPSGAKLVRHLASS